MNERSGGISRRSSLGSYRGPSLSSQNRSQSSKLSQSSKQSHHSGASSIDNFKHHTSGSQSQSSKHGSADAAEYSVSSAGFANGHDSRRRPSGANEEQHIWENQERKDDKLRAWGESTLNLSNTKEMLAVVGSSEIVIPTYSSTNYPLASRVTSPDINIQDISQEQSNAASQGAEVYPDNNKPRSKSPSSGRSGRSGETSRAGSSLNAKRLKKTKESTTDENSDIAIAINRPNSGTSKRDSACAEHRTSISLTNSIDESSYFIQADIDAMGTKYSIARPKSNSLDKPDGYKSDDEESTHGKSLSSLKSRRASLPVKKVSRGSYHQTPSVDLKLDEYILSSLVQGKEIKIKSNNACHDRHHDLNLDISRRHHSRDHATSPSPEHGRKSTSPKYKYKTSITSADHVRPSTSSSRNKNMNARKESEPCVYTVEDQQDGGITFVRKSQSEGMTEALQFEYAGLSQSSISEMLFENYLGGHSPKRTSVEHSDESSEQYQSKTSLDDMQTHKLMNSVLKSELRKQTQDTASEARHSSKELEQCNSSTEEQESIHSGHQGNQMNNTEQVQVTTAESGQSNLADQLQDSIGDELGREFSEQRCYICGKHMQTIKRDEQEEKHEAQGQNDTSRRCSGEQCVDGQSCKNPGEQPLEETVNQNSGEHDDTNEYLLGSGGLVQLQQNAMQSAPAKDISGTKGMTFGNASKNSNVVNNNLNVNNKNRILNLRNKNVQTGKNSSSGNKNSNSGNNNYNARNRNLNIGNKNFMSEIENFNVRNRNLNTGANPMMNNDLNARDNSLNARDSNSNARDGNLNTKDTELNANNKNLNAGEDFDSLTEDEREPNASSQFLYESDSNDSDISLSRTKRCFLCLICIFPRHHVME